MDVLFKWWVEPGIAEIHRQLIIDIMMRMKDHWVKHRDYAAELAARIVSEIESMTKSGPRLKLVEVSENQYSN